MVSKYTVNKMGRHIVKKEKEKENYVTEISRPTLAKKKKITTLHTNTFIRSSKPGKERFH